MPVQSALAKKTDLPEVLTALGRIEASASVIIKSQINGELLAKYFDEGQYVKKGDKLFSLDPRPYATALAVARADLERNQILMEKAHEDMTRYQALIGKSVVSKEQYDQIKSVYESLKATVKANEATVANAQVQLDYCTIYAPISGKIGRISVDVGNIIKAQDTALVSIEQMQPIRVAFSLPEKELGIVLERTTQESLPVEVYFEGGKEKTERGTLLFFDNAVDKNTGTILLVAELQNPNLYLFPGQFVKVALYIDTLRDALVIPRSAIQSGSMGLFVFVVNDEGTVSIRSVSTGYQTKEETVITEGLQEGDRVVTAGHLRLKEGTPVSETSASSHSHP